MAGHPLGVGESAFPNHADPLKCREERDRSVTALRRFLRRLALDTHTPGAVIDAAVQAVSDMVGAPCAFVEGATLPEPAPGHTAVVVSADGVSLGALILSTGAMRQSGLSDGDFLEVAELIGLALVNASQAQALREMESDSEDMLRYAPDAIFVIARDGIVTLANQKALTFVGGGAAAEVEGRHIREVFGAEVPDMERLMAVATGEGVLEVETHGPGGTRLACLSLSVIGEAQEEQILCVARDITSERQAQLALRRSERAALMGQTLEYLLHEVNNPLAALIANLSFVQKRARELDTLGADHAGRPPGVGGSSGGTGSRQALPKLHRALASAATAAERIRETMSALRSAHVGRPRTGTARVDVRYELSLAVSAAEQELPTGIRLQKALDGVGHICAPPLALAEALGALIKNAVQAVGDSGAGWVRVWSRCCGGGDLAISVEDSGPGVQDSIKDRIFMPFFTTKPLGEALGLGLSLADDAVRRMGGRLSLVSGAGHGALFEVILPLCQGGPSAVSSTVERDTGAMPRPLETLAGR